ncbi:hypothetical protein BGX29_008580 [Mortierella sp. GBA35]|nr:hypothetical protein BGX29_008580 [Mortierella sp. GBA35]
MPASPLSSVPTVTLAAVVGGSEAHNSDPEPVLGDVEQYLENQHQLLQSNRLAQEARAHKAATRSSSRSQLSTELGLGLCPPGAIESDISSNSSLRESSDYDTLETEDDDKGIPGSDSNDTDSIVDDALALDRRSRRKRSMQRLVAKNKTLKSSLQQAKADLAAERHNRALIDQIYLKIKKELNSKLEAEELKVVNLRAELEQMTQDMQELKEKSTSYKIGYDSSAYSLSSGLGGLMLHHSNLPDCDDDEEEEEQEQETSTVPETSRRTNEECSQSRGWRDSKREDEEEEQEEEEAPEEDHGDKATIVEQGDDSEKKVSFLATPIDTPARTRSPLPIAEPDDEHQDEDEYEGDDSDDEDAPCTMMELLIKKEQYRCSEDDTQDAAADADETFDSMAEKFLHQALRAKFTAARTILQLDDLLLKYDAVPEDLVLVLSHELTKWWEKERVEAGGPATGGWGAGSVLMPETGDHVSAKVAVETKFKSVYVPLLLNYVASHKEQMMLLEKLERYAKANDKWKRNHTAQLMALYKFDVLDADAILEWWRLLKEPQGVFGHGNGLRSMSSKFVAWLEEEEDDSDDDSDDGSDDDDSDEESDLDDGVEEEEFDPIVDADGQGKIVGLELLSPRNLIQSLDDDLAQADAENEQLMVIGSDDGMDDQMSTSSSLERIEECERKRRISFCTNNVYIHQNGRVRVDKAPVVDEQGRKMVQCPPFEDRVNEDDEDEVEENSGDDNDDDDDDE